jgi:lipopolysaccharide transport system ATP-binding protein
MDQSYIKARSLRKTYGHSMLGEGARMAASVLGVNMRPGGIVALDDVSLEIRHGERIGVIGENGAGKSTLLHLLAGMVAATGGEIEVRGRVSCIMSIGTGIREELTGRENVILDAQIHGDSRQEIERYVEAVASFADLGEFIDRPVRTYSTGMKSRLSFAMISGIDPQILIIDEALSAGDVVFARKAAARMKELTRRGAIVIVVSHSMESIRELCNRCIWMSRGRIVYDGDPAAVTDAYMKAVRDRDEARMQQEFAGRIKSAAPMDGIRFEALVVSAGGSTKPRFSFSTDDSLSLTVGLQSATRRIGLDLRVRLTRMDGILVVDRLASADGFQVGSIEPGATKFEIGLGDLGLGQGTYQLEVDLVDRAAAYVNAAISSFIHIHSELAVIGNPLMLRRAHWQIATPAGAR